MKKILKPKTIIMTAVIMLLMATAGFVIAPAAKACPLITLVSPPSTLNVCNLSCGAIINCAGCTNTLTLSSASTACGPYTWTFTNTTTGCVKVFTTSGSSASLTFQIRGNTGDAITLVISTSPTTTSPTYNFTGVVCP